MLVDVQAVDLLLAGNAQADGLFQQEEHQCDGNADPSAYSQHAQHLYAQEAEAPAVKQAAVRGEQAREHSAQRAVDKMHADGTHRVVNFELLVDELNAEHHCEARDQPDNGRAERVHCVAAADDMIAIGEVGLGGEVRNVTNLEYRLRESQRMGFVRAVVPKHSLAQIDPKEFNTMELLGVTYVKQAIQLL